MLIRSLQKKDCPEILEIYKPHVESTAVSFEYAVPNIETFEARCCQIAENYPYLVALDDNGEIMGYAYAARFRERKAYDFTLETSVYVGEKFKNMGVAKKLYSILEVELKRRGIKEMIGVISLPNEASINFHKKCGFEEAGIIKRAGYKFKKWWDIALYQKSI